MALKLPEFLIPIPLGGPANPLGVAVLVDERGGGGGPVVLRELIDGRIYLGALLDAGGRFHRYLELWIQQASSLARATHLSSELLQNSQLDEKWQAMVKAWAATEGEDVLVTGWERDADRVVQLDVAGRAALVLAGAAGKPLRLCRDEAALRAAGLPSYATTLHRYLTDGKQLVAATPDAPLGNASAAVAVLPPPVAKKPVLNPEGGPILVRSLHPIGVAPYGDFLGGAPAEMSIGAGGKSPQPWLDDAVANDPTDPGWVLGSHGTAGHMIEVLYLKLSLLLDAFRAVRDMTESAQRPLLNLTADSFRVRFPTIGGAGASLPRRWAARAVLSAGSEAIPLAVPGIERGCFVAAKTQGEASYRAPAMRGGSSGTGVLRIRRVAVKQTGQFALEATLVAPGLMRPAKTDLVWLRVALDGHTFDLWGRAETGGTAGAGEFRFRSLETPANPSELEALRRAEGWSAPDVAYAVTPVLSSPCDLYAVAAVCARVLLVNAERPLAITIDELMSLAAAPRSDDGTIDVPLDEAVTQRLRGDEALADQLGAQHLMYDPTGHVPWAGAIPVQLWARVLSFIMRCFPGVVPESFASGSGDAPSEAIHRVFDPAIEELAALVDAARSLIFMDWYSSREICEIISRRAADAERLLADADVEPDTELDLGPDPEEESEQEPEAARDDAADATAQATGQATAPTSAGSAPGVAVPPPAAVQKFAPPPGGGPRTHGAGAAGGRRRKSFLEAPDAALAEPTDAADR